MTRAQKHLFRMASVTAAFIPALVLAHAGHGAGLHTHGEGRLMVAGMLFASFGLIAAGVAAIRRARH